MPNSSFTKLLESANSNEFEKRYGKKDGHFWKKKLFSSVLFNGIEEKIFADFMLSIEHSKKKLPALAKKPYTLIPPPEKLNAAQSSSEKTAVTKAQILKNYKRVIDLCGGYGIDAFYISNAKNYIHIEPNKKLNSVANFNFLERENVQCLNYTAEQFLETYIPKKGDVIYADPSRVNNNNQRVSLLEDYLPDIRQLPKFCQEHNCGLLLKLSPMLDVNALKQQWPNYTFDVHLVVLSNELKELLLHFHRDCKETFEVHSHQNESVIHNIVNVNSSSNTKTLANANFVYDANPAFRKLHAQNYLSEYYKLCQQDGFLISDELIENFPGKVFKVVEDLELDKKSKRTINKGKFSVVSRNNKMPSKEIELRFKLTPSSNDFLLFYENNGKGKVFVAKRVY